MATKEKLRKFSGLQFLSKQAGSFSGVPQRSVQSWAEKKVVMPDIEDTTGTGKRRLYSVVNCIELGIVKSLTKKKMPLNVIRECISLLRTEKKLHNILSFWPSRQGGAKQAGVAHIWEHPLYSPWFLIIYFTDTDDSETPFNFSILIERPWRNPDRNDVPELSIAKNIGKFDNLLAIDLIRIAEKVLSKISSIRLGICM